MTILVPNDPAVDDGSLPAVAVIPAVPPQPRDLAPLSLLIGSLLRRSWLIVAVAALAGGLAWLLTETGGDVETGEAVARVGLTQETPWPFYDVELESGSVLVETPEFRGELEQRVGFEIDSISGSLPEFLAVFDVTVTAASAEDAATAANEAANLVVESAGDEAARLVVEEIARIDAEIADLQTRIDAAAAETEAAAAELTEVYLLQGDGNDPDLWDQAFALEERRSRASTEGNDLLRFLTDLETERTSLQLRANPLPTFRVLRTAEATTVEPDSNRLPVSIAAAFAALVAAAVAVAIFDRRVGAVRSRWQLAHVCGATTLPDVRIERDGTIAGSGMVADVLHGGLDTDRKTIGIVNFTSRMNLEDFAAEVSAQGVASTLTTDPRHDSGDEVQLVDVTDEFATEDAPRRLSRSCDALLVLASKSHSLREVTNVATRGSSSPGAVLAAFVRE